jgi:hypothetical protein
MYDAANQRWCQRLRSLGKQRLQAVAPAQIILNEGAQEHALPVTQTVRLTAPRGRYLLRVDCAQQAKLLSAMPGVLCVHRTHDVREAVTDVACSFDVHICQAHENTAFLVHEHLGGAMFVSLAGGDSGRHIGPVDVFSVEANDASISKPWDLDWPLPEVSRWSRQQARQVGRHADQSGVVDVHGDDSHWQPQITSPPIVVPQGSQFELRLPVQVQTGQVAVGILDYQRHTWLIAPETLQQVYRFEAPPGGRVAVVVANCQPASACVPTRFRVRDGTLTLVGSKAIYVDELMRWWKK